MGVLAASLLQAPGRRVVEVEAAKATTAARVVLLEVVANVETRVALSLLPDAIRVLVVASNLVGLLKSSIGILLNL